MRPDQIRSVVPLADPEFIRTFEQLPEPPPGAFEHVMQILPELHRLFLEKRAAAEKGDRALFINAVAAEVVLIEAMDAA